VQQSFDSRNIFRRIEAAVIQSNLSRHCFPGGPAAYFGHLFAPGDNENGAQK
jgi:hypothetical protein